MKRNENTRFSKKLFALALIFVMLVSTCVVYAEEETTENPADNLILDDYSGYWTFYEYDNCFSMYRFPEKMTIRTGDEISLSLEVGLPGAGREWLDYYSLESNDENILTIDGKKSVDNARDTKIKARKPGVATLKFVRIEQECDDSDNYYNAYYTYYVQITVIDKKDWLRTMTPNKAKVISQVNSGSLGYKPYVYSNKVEVGFKPLGSEGREKVTYELWRSTQKDGTYEKVAAATVTELNQAEMYGYSTGGTLDDGEYYLVDKKNVKANTKYYYKIRSRFTEGDVYVDSPNIEIYWTAPKVKTRIGYSKSLKRYAWKKVKGVAGYVYWVGEDGDRELIWNSTFSHYTYTGGYDGYRTTKTYAKKGVTVLSVSPYTKHGKYYYMANHPLTKNKSNLTDIEYLG